MSDYEPEAGGAAAIGKLWRLTDPLTGEDPLGALTDPVHSSFVNIPPRDVRTLWPFKLVGLFGREVATTPGGAELGTTRTIRPSEIRLYPARSISDIAPGVWP